MTMFTLMRSGEYSISIIVHQRRDFFCVHRDLSHFVPLTFDLLRSNTMNGKVDPWCHRQMEVLSGLFSADDIYKTSNLSRYHLAIYLNEL